jgi:BMFP domain-containing protein YqiC
MQTRNRIFDDAAKLAGGAVGTLEGVRREIEALVRQQVERILSRFDLVTRDEFDAVKDMAARARAEQEELAKRLKMLEASQPTPTVTTKTSMRKTPKSKKS